MADLENGADPWNQAYAVLKTEIAEQYDRLYGTHVLNEMVDKVAEIRNDIAGYEVIFERERTRIEANQIVFLNCPDMELAREQLRGRARVFAAQTLESTK